MKYLVCLLLLGLFFRSEFVEAQTPAHQAGYLYLSPVPSASYVSTQTRYVLVRFTQTNPSALTNLANFITVSGETSGSHPGTTRIATDARTVIFEMSSGFAQQELVTVSLNPAMAQTSPGDVLGYQYQFMTSAPFPGSLSALVLGRPIAQPIPTPLTSVAQKVPRSILTKGAVGRKAQRLSNGVSVPGDFPAVNISVNSNPSPGYLFLENGLDGVPPYTMMLDNSGQAVWYRRGRMYDFKIQQNGMITWCLSDDSGFPAFDQNFNYLKTYATTNGYLTDGHELKILPDGRYFMIGYQTNSVEMSQYVLGDYVTASVRETVVQGFTAADELIFQWRAWDNFNLGDEGGNPDFSHMNGLDIDKDGNLLISSRHLSEITKVDLNSGDIIWRLGGPHNQFRFINDSFGGPSYQHNISALGNGHYLIFDNGDTRTPPFSRATEYQLNPGTMTANLVWQFRDSPDKYAFWMGSAQRLPSGNTLIDFVAPDYPKAIEVDANGVKHFELSLDPASDSYRAFRLPWTGVVAAPYLVAESQADSVSLIYNKFGDHNLAGYRIYGGTSPHPTNVLAQSTSTLETLTNLSNGRHFFRVTSLLADNSESPFSNEEYVDIHVLRPGQNQIINGNFAQGSVGWYLNVAPAANAAWTILGGSSHFYISSGGTSLSSIQLLQGGMALAQGSNYVLQFDAWSSASRYLQAQLAQSGSPFTDYSHLALAFVTPNRTRFTYQFTMKDASDSSANLLFNFGAATGDVFIANVNLFNPAPGDFNLDGRFDLLDLGVFSNGWLKQQSPSPADLDANGIVNFRDFNLLGNFWGTGGSSL
jgi:hypothetical protein